jgi:hypothetical protein
VKRAPGVSARLPAALAVLALLALLGGIALSGAHSARADGDPASDVLLGQDAFLPYSPISQTVERRLYAVTGAARQAGYPLKVALIGTRTDLGVVSVLFGKPQRYARYLSSELVGAVNSPVLVVMPSGFGLAAQGRTLSAVGLAGIPIGPGADGLGRAAIIAAGRLAAAAGHRLAPGATSSAPGGASPATTDHAVLAIVVLGALAGAAIGAAFVTRSRRSWNSETAQPHRHP